MGFFSGVYSPNMLGYNGRATVHNCAACQFDLNQHVGQNLTAVADDLQIWKSETRFRSTYQRLTPP